MLVISTKAYFVLSREEKYPSKLCKLITLCCSKRRLVRAPVFP